MAGVYASWHLLGASGGVSAFALLPATPRVKLFFSGPFEETSHPLIFQDPGSSRPLGDSPFQPRAKSRRILFSRALGRPRLFGAPYLKLCPLCGVGSCLGEATGKKKREHHARTGFAFGARRRGSISGKLGPGDPLVGAKDTEWTSILTSGSLNPFSPHFPQACFAHRPLSAG